MNHRTTWKAHSAHTLLQGQTHCFRGRTMREALKRAEAALGSELWVVGTSRSNTWSRFLNPDSSSQWYEVEAATAATEPDTADALSHDNLKIVHRAVSHLEETGNDPLKLWDVPSSLNAPYQYLIRAGVDEAYAERIARHAAACHNPRDLVEDSSAWQAMIDAVADGVNVAHRAPIQEGEKRVIMVVGPTGAGKTTSLAKMAAHLQLTSEERVGLISCDMFRIAAVEQLDTYARIMNMPFAAADSAQAVADAVAEIDADWVLIDTPGRGPLDDNHLAILSEMVDVLNPDEIHLVLPIESAGRWAKLTADKFSVVRPDRLIVTKIDETDRHGGLINLLADLKLPFSYISTGQNVPQDFYPANPDQIASMIMG
jgi:flagellar biosynthesis protein FlhF